MTSAFPVQDILRMQMMGSSIPSYKTLLNLIGFELFQKVIQTYPFWNSYVSSMCCRRKLGPSTTPPPTNKEVRCTIECDRILSQPTAGKQNTVQSQSHSRMDSVIHYITTLPVIRNLLCMTHNDYLPNEYDALQIEPDLYFQLLSLKHADGVLEQIKFKLFCYDHDMPFLQLFIDRCNTDYERRMANKLGTSLYFFDMMTNSKNKRSMQNQLPTTHLIYTKHKFYTTRTFDNVFFEQRPVVKKHVEFFLNRKDWYEKKGIPYTLGFLFHGSPGTGKTSSVKAIANTARRHIINIQLSEIKTKSQLRHLFFNDEIHVNNGSTTERYTIPVHERLFVIEDIDAMGDSLLRREWKKPESSIPKAKTGDPWIDERDEESKEPIDLSFLLNLLDGTLESSGRILAISSNFPERIDRALIRPGRIDMIVHFKKCNRSVLEEMVTSFYDGPCEGLTCEDYTWSPAEVNQILFRNFDTPNNAIRELNELKPADLYGFDLLENNSALSYEAYASSAPLTDE
uniref:AAA+ ATPase domain-containing protein n=1 Tax=viral metagenome TaxID=1070528 RepID=A0A6C0JWQ5_9ZZZZ